MGTNWTGLWYFGSNTEWATKGKRANLNRTWNQRWMSKSDIEYETIGKWENIIEYETNGEWT